MQGVRGRWRVEGEGKITWGRSTHLSVAAFGHPPLFSITDRKETWTDGRHGMTREAGSKKTCLLLFSSLFLSCGCVTRSSPFSSPRLSPPLLSSAINNPYSSPSAERKMSVSGGMGRGKGGKGARPHLQFLLPCPPFLSLRGALSVDNFPL